MAKRVCINIELIVDEMDVGNALQSIINELGSWHCKTEVHYE